MANLLSGTAFITGAGSGTGIGQATAIAFAEHGITNLTLADLNKDSLLETVRKLSEISSSVRTVTFEMDVAVEADVDAAITETVKQFGSLDYAINNAGVGGPIVPTAEIDYAAWKRCIDVNLHGVFLCQKAEIKQMLEQVVHGDDYRRVRGVIVNVASMLGVVALPSTLTSPAYVASKHAVMGLTKADGVYYADKGVRINAVCPGYVETPLLRRATESGAMATEFARIPTGRLATMQEIASTIVFLASPMSSYMHGAGLVVDGGYTCY